MTRLIKTITRIKYLWTKIIKNINKKRILILMLKNLLILQNQKSHIITTIKQMLIICQI